MQVHRHHFINTNKPQPLYTSVYICRNINECVYFWSSFVLHWGLKSSPVPTLVHLTCIYISFLCSRESDLFIFPVFSLSLPYMLLSLCRSTRTNGLAPLGWIRAVHIKLFNPWIYPASPVSRHTINKCHWASFTARSRTDSGRLAPPPSGLCCFSISTSLYLDALRLILCRN